MKRFRGGSCFCKQLQEFVLETCRDGRMAISSADPALGFTILHNTGFAPEGLWTLELVSHACAHRPLLEMHLPHAFLQIFLLRMLAC